MLRIIKERIERQTEIIIMPLNSILDLNLEYCVCGSCRLLSKGSGGPGKGPEEMTGAW